MVFYQISGSKLEPGRMFPHRVLVARRISTPPWLSFGRVALKDSSLISNTASSLLLEIER